MENISIIDILNTGVTGFAFLMLYLGYKLTSDVQTKIFEQKADSFPNVEMYREWKNLVLSQLKSTRYFQIFSLIFFAGGLSLLLYQYQAESKIILSVSPPEKIYAPTVHHQSEALDLNDGGRAVILVKNEHNISISNDNLVKKVNELVLTLEDQKKTISRLMIANANSSSDSGF